MTSWSAPVPETHRNWVIWVFFFLAVFAAIGAFLDAARYMGWISVGSIGSIDFFLEDANWLGGFFAGLLGFIWIAIAGWLWSSDPRGWMFVVILASLNLFFVLINLIGSATFENIWPSLAINGAILILAFLPGTKKAFGVDEQTYPAP
jgi:hypothetical protein